MKYSLRKAKSKIYKNAVAVNEWCDNKGKWTKLKKPLGSPNEPLDDEAFNQFIQENNVAEVNLMIIGTKGSIHNVDFSLEELEA